MTYDLLGIKTITAHSPDLMYSIKKSQVIVFPFKLDSCAKRIEASHNLLYNNQHSSILAWASNEPNGRSITGNNNPSLSRTNLTSRGSSWLFHLLETNLKGFEPAQISQWIYPNQTYYMCFQNLENKDNVIYVKFTNLI